MTEGEGMMGMATAGGGLESSISSFKRTFGEESMLPQRNVSTWRTKCSKRQGCITFLVIKAQRRKNDQKRHWDIMIKI